MTDTEKLTKKMRQWTLIFPVIGLVVAGGIVWHECDRRDRISREIASIEQEIGRIRGAHPELSRGGAHSDEDHDGHDHDDHKG